MIPVINVVLVAAIGTVFHCRCLCHFHHTSSCCCCVAYC